MSKNMKISNLENLSTRMPSALLKKETDPKIINFPYFSDTVFALLD
jgi:hypothetical protein